MLPASSRMLAWRVLERLSHAWCVCINFKRKSILSHFCHYTYSIMHVWWLVLNTKQEATLLSEKARTHFSSIFTNPAFSLFHFVLHTADIPTRLIRWKQRQPTLLSLSVLLSSGLLVLSQTDISFDIKGLKENTFWVKTRLLENHTEIKRIFSVHAYCSKRFLCKLIKLANIYDSTSS